MNGHGLRVMGHLAGHGYWEGRETQTLRLHQTFVYRVLSYTKSVIVATVGQGRTYQSGARA